MPEENQQQEEKNNLFIATGRRKTAVASVFLKQGKGKILVNGVNIDEYFKGESAKVKWTKPFFVAGIGKPEASFNATIKVRGSGISSQLDAVVLGLARAISKAIPSSRQSLRKQGLLTRDPRMVERKKPFLRKARKSPQYSKR